MSVPSSKPTVPWHRGQPSVYSDGEGKFHLSSQDSDPHINKNDPLWWKIFVRLFKAGVLTAAVSGIFVFLAADQISDALEHRSDNDAFVKGLQACHSAPTPILWSRCFHKLVKLHQE
ncbi:MAG: hypothetical protein MPK06_00295 [Alphaproteobacteria bacterium]|nr:hypothetical protein [Alphaproteobacteria bacterium]MDA8004087.1 hypothetical protein [Alphaproteobacteria bacterium]MDA8004982.1 hypothetical protein [Alphaproteobacteria bacterium]MDA8012968.1 hypothetical protein [Alphaproteobacteria bacterium]